jgi:acyl carrier protein
MNKPMRTCIQIALFVPLVFIGCGTRHQNAQESTTNQVQELFAKQMGVKLESVSSSTTLGDVGADELDFVELVMELEEKFDVSIPDDRAEQLAGGDMQKGLGKVTVGKLAGLVDELVTKKRGKR